MIGWTIEDVGHLAQGRHDFGVVLTRGEVSESFGHLMTQAGNELRDVPDGAACGEDMPTWWEPEHHVYTILRQRPWVWQ